jgi:hypothetical protein
MKIKNSEEKTNSTEANIMTTRLHLLVNNSKVTIFFPNKAEDTVVNDIKRMMLGSGAKK